MGVDELDADELYADELDTNGGYMESAPRTSSIEFNGALSDDISLPFHNAYDSEVETQGDWLPNDSNAGDDVIWEWESVP